MGIKRYCSIVIVLVLLTGCGTIGEYSELRKIENPDTKKIEDVMTVVAELKLNRPGAIKVEKDGIKMELDTREPNLWERNVVPIFKGAIQGTQTVIE